MTSIRREPRIVVEDLPAEHLADLEFLWDQRATRAYSGDDRIGELANLDRRIAAHLAGLAAVPRVSWPVLAEAVGAEEPSLAGAAALALLQRGDATAHTALLAVLESGPAPARAGVRRALLWGPLAGVRDALRGFLRAPDPWLAVTAHELLAAHGEPLASSALAEGFAHPDAAVRLAAARAAAWLSPPAPALETLARADGDAEVQAAAFEAGAWQRAAWVLPLGRERARASRAPLTAPEAQILRLFAALAEPADAAVFAALASAATLGPARWEAVAAFGSTPCIEASLAGLASPDAPEAEAAGRAFARMTGLDLGAARRVPAALPAGASADDAEFADEAFVPDPGIAKQKWEGARSAFESGRRWNRGGDVETGAAAALASADLAARFEAGLRARFRAQGAASRRELWLLP